MRSACSKSLRLRRANRIEQRAPALPFTTPAPDNFASFPVRHLVQVAQTEFKSSDPQRAFGWSPDGNRTNAETYLRAIQAAREYIYIEDQYLVPDDRYIHALVNASQHCKRLVVVGAERDR